MGDSDAAPHFCFHCGKPAAGPRCDHCQATQQVRQYVLQRLVAESPRGRTYVGVAPSGQRVFLKELLFATAPDAKTIDGFFREAELLRQLKHRAIPSFVDSFGEGEGAQAKLYLVESLVEGPSLLQELDGHRYTEEEVKRLARDVLAILSFLHRLVPPVLHRDIKPANIVRGPDERIFLVDFGVACEMSAPGGTVVGTFGYTAPEQMNGVTSTRSDLYSLGATLAHLLSRRPPWELMKNGLEIDLSSLFISRGFKVWLRRLLAQRPDRRFASADQALNSLGKAAVRARATLWRAGVGVALLLVLALASPGIVSLLRQVFMPLIPEGVSERCPPGTVLLGAAPPLGTEQFCATVNGGTRRKNGVDVTWEFNSNVRYVKEISHYLAGEKEGLESTWDYDPRQQIPLKRSEGQYKAGKRTGPWAFLPTFNAPTVSEGAFAFGQKTGPWKEYFSNGRVETEGVYEADLRVGVWITYYESGRKKREQSFLGGHPEGPLRSWNAAGGLEEEATYTQGWLTGLHTRYFPNGQKQTEVTEERPSGIFQGPYTRRESREWYPSGKLRSLNVFQPGTSVSANTTSFFESGVISSEKDSVHEVEYYENGKKRVEKLQDSSNDGRYRLREWYLDGTLKSEGMCDRTDSWRIGTWRMYYPSGKAKTEETYAPDGRNGYGRSGLYKAYFENGRLHEMGSYQGHKVGIWTEWDEGGRVVLRTEMGGP